MKNVYKILLPAIMLCCVAAEDGCKDHRVDTTMQVQKLNESRFTVKRVGVFEDDLAYDGKRGIYLITDENTKKQYFGVSGIGINELGQHGGDDKNSPSRDER